MCPIFVLLSVALTLGFVSEVHGQVDKSEPKPTIDSTVQEAFRKLRVGMTVREIEDAIRPVLIESGKASLGGSGRSERVYHLRGDLQFAVGCDGYPHFDKVISVGELKPKKRWRVYEWAPSEKDKADAWVIAVAAVQKEVKAGKGSAEKFPTNPGGRRVFNDQLTAEIEIKPGVKK